MGKLPTVAVAFLLSWTTASADPAAPGSPVPVDQRTHTPVSLKPLATHFADQRQHSYLSPNFVILHDTEPWRARSHADLLERTHAQFYEAFEQADIDLQPLADRLVCLLFAHEEDFSRYGRRVEGMDLSWTGGYYSARTNRVALFERDWPGDRPTLDDPDAAEVVHDLDPGRPTIRLATLEPKASDDRHDGLASTIHEAAHQLAFNSGLQRRGVMYPFWLSEGIAISFETQRPSEPFGPGHVNLDRLHDLRQAHQAGHLLPLERLVSLVRPPVDDPEMVPVVYAQAWALFHHLFTHQPDALRDYLAKLGQLSPGWRNERALRHEFIAAFGSIEALEADWQDHLADLAMLANE